MNKEDIRKRIVTLRQASNLNSEIIINKLLELEQFKAAKSIHCYISKGKEIDTRNILELKDKNVFVPYIEDNVIKYSRFSGFDNMTLNSFGVMEPVNPASETIELNVVIVPGLAFDKKGNRIGYGKGYYDKFLVGKENTLKVALAYEYQILDDLPVEEHDIPVDMVITEENLYERD